MDTIWLGILFGIGLILAPLVLELMMWGVIFVVGLLVATGLSLIFVYFIFHPCAEIMLLLIKPNPKLFLELTLLINLILCPAACLFDHFRHRHASTKLRPPLDNEHERTQLFADELERRFRKEGYFLPRPPD